MRAQFVIPVLASILILGLISFNDASATTEDAKLTASDAAASDLFGFSVSTSGDTTIVGSVLDDDGASDSGSAYVFVRSGTTWTEQAKLTASDAAASDLFGFPVSISGDTVIVGTVLNADAASPSGAAYIFVRSGTTWTEQVMLTSSDGKAGDRFGHFVSISGDTVIVGAPFSDSVKPSTGAAYVFDRNFGGTNNWGQTLKLTASDAATLDTFGLSVSISGDTAIVGAQADDDTGFSSGSAYVFELDFPPPIPDLISPTDNSIIDDKQPDLTWSGVIDPEGSVVSYVPRLVNTANPTVEIELVELSLVSAEPLTVLPEGNYEWKVKSMDEFGNTLGFSTPSTFTVVTDVITSNTSGNVDMSPGDTVIVTGGGSVSGNIINDGGTLTVEAGSTVDGNIITTNGGTITIDGSSVNGNVDGGDSTISITGGSTVLGNVSSDGSASVVITDSSVQGSIDVANAQNVSITGNTVSGGLSVTDSSSVTVSGNTVSGSLSVINSSPVTVSGNTVSGNLTIENCTSCTEENNTVTGTTDVLGCVPPPPGPTCPPDCGF